MGLKKAGWDVVGRSLKMREAVQSSSAVGEYMSGYSIRVDTFFYFIQVTAFTGGSNYLV